MRSFPTVSVVTVLLALAGVVAPAAAEEWAGWRGPNNDGVSTETGLVSSWSKAGENLLWRADLTGRSTPVVFDGRACANGRTGEGDLRQEWVGCFDAATGQKLWDHRFNVYHTSVPWNRVGWASVAGDPETGYLYVQGVGGTFLCLDRDGKIVWERNLVEDFGFASGFGGRTQTPLVDEGRVIVPFVSTGWAELSPPRHRLYAFDKKNGDLIWVANPSTPPEDMNSQSTPAVVIVDGRRLLVAGYSEGWVYATDARTGEKVWSFQLSKRSINTSPVVGADGTIFLAHSEENMDSEEMGRMVAIDPRGSGDVSKTNEKWRVHIEAGFSTPAYSKGKLYIVDNSANLYQVDAASGHIDWTFDLGTVGKASPVVADGKVYVTEVNGRVHIVKIGPTSAEGLSVVELHMPDGRPAEIYGSFAVAYGRLYFTSEEGFYALGDKTKVAKIQPGPKTVPGPPQDPAPAGATPTKLLIVPGEVSLKQGGNATFKLLAFDAKGREVTAPQVTWALEGLAGTVDAGKLSLDAAKAVQAGKVTAKAGELTAAARVRAFGEPALREDFEAVAVKQRPGYFLSGLGRFEVAEVEGGKVLAKGPAPEGIHRHKTFVGPAWWSEYTIQADLQGIQTGRKLPDMGLINSGYAADLMGAQQQIQVRSWESELRASKQVPFPWQPATWYTMKLKVATTAGGKSVVQVKVWKKGEAEPADWTLTAEDPLPIPAGAPGLYGFSPSPIYFDNVSVTRN